MNCARQASVGQVGRTVGSGFVERDIRDDTTDGRVFVSAARSLARDDGELIERRVRVPRLIERSATPCNDLARRIDDVPQSIHTHDRPHHRVT